MPDWFTDFFQDYAVQIAVAGTLALCGGLWFLVKKLANRLSRDEKTLLRWGYESDSNSIVVIEALGRPRTVSVRRTWLDRDREKWLVALESLVKRDLLDQQNEYLYRLKPSSYALAKKFPLRDPAPYQLSTAHGLSQSELLQLAVAVDSGKPIHVMRVDHDTIVRIGGMSYSTSKDGPVILSIVRKLEERGFIQRTGGVKGTENYEPTPEGRLLRKMLPE